MRWRPIAALGSSLLAAYRLPEPYLSIADNFEACPYGRLHTY